MSIHCRCVSVSILLVSGTLGAVCLQAVSQPGPRGDIASLAARLRQARNANRGSYQRFLQQSYHIIDSTLNGADWSAVEQPLRRQGFVLGQKVLVGTGRESSFTLPQLGYQPSSGPFHALKVDFEIRARIARTAPTRKVIRLQSVALSARVDQPFAKYAAGSPYPVKTVLSEVLKEPLLAKQAQNLPILERISVEYHPPMFPLSSVLPPGSSFPYGYLMIVDLARRMPDSTKSVRLMFDASSGLDEPTTEPKSPPSPTFKPADTFGPISRFGGGGESEGGSKYGMVIERVGRKPAEPETESDAPDAYTGADLRAKPSDARALRLLDHYLVGDDLVELRRFLKLKRLDMSQLDGDSNRPIRATDLEVIGGLRELDYLSLQGDAVTDQVCARVAGLHKLKHLSISSGKITDRGVQLIAGLPHLEELELPYCSKLTDDSVRAISKIAGLRKLNLLSTGQFTGSAMGSLSRLTQLRELTVGTIKKARDRDFAFIANLKELTDLFLGYMPLGDGCLTYLARLPKLKILDITELKGLTDRGIQTLRSLSRIEWLCIQFCPKVTPAGIRRLAKSLPGKFTAE